MKKQIEEISLKFQVHFNSLIWLCYRKNFAPLFVGEEEYLTKWIKTLPKDLGRDLKIGHTTDSGWGCTIRVAQMMLCHTFLRHHHKDHDIVNWHQLARSNEYIDVL